LYKPNE
jgi:hypothetical protein